MEVIKGDLIELAKKQKFDVIVHGANCFCTMGAGIAKRIKSEFTHAFFEDIKTKRGDKNKLGTCTFAYFPIYKLYVINAYIQYDFRGGGDKVDYAAVRNCMKWIANEFAKQKIGLPKIGAGLAGGNWKKILSIIEKELVNCDVTIVKYLPELNLKELDDQYGKENDL